MKSAEEIEKFLKNRPWFEKFKKNVERGDVSGDDSSKILQGYYFDDTIRAAFCWEFTPEGFNYWRKRNEQFLRWYHSSEPIGFEEEDFVTSITMFVSGMSFSAMIVSIAGGLWVWGAANAICLAWLQVIRIKIINGR